MTERATVLRMCTGLEAPKTFREASEKERSEVSNGCGPQWAAFDIVPDHLFGLRIGCACDIHDWMYEEGAALEDKDVADATFYRNMRSIVEREGGWLKQPRLLLAWWYYRAVKRFGRDSFTGE